MKKNKGTVICTLMTIGLIVVLVAAMTLSLMDDSGMYVANPDSNSSIHYIQK